MLPPCVGVCVCVCATCPLFHVTELVHANFEGTTKHGVVVTFRLSSLFALVVSPPKEKDSSGSTLKFRMALSGFELAEKPKTRRTTWTRAPCSTSCTSRASTWSCPGAGRTRGMSSRAVRTYFLGRQASCVFWLFLCWSKESIAGDMSSSFEAAEATGSQLLSPKRFSA